MWRRRCPLTSPVTKSSLHTDLVGVGWRMWGSAGGGSGVQFGTLMKEDKNGKDWGKRVGAGTRDWSGRKGNQGAGVLRVSCKHRAGRACLPGMREVQGCLSACTENLRPWKAGLGCGGEQKTNDKNKSSPGRMYLLSTSCVCRK